MDTKFLNKLSLKVQFRVKTLETGKLEYTVERKSLDSDEWEEIAKSLKIERALWKKHHAWMAELHRLGQTNKILNRRKSGKSALFHKKRKRKSPNYKNLTRS